MARFANNRERTRFYSKQARRRKAALKRGDITVDNAPLEWLWYRSADVLELIERNMTLGEVGAALGGNGERIIRRFQGQEWVRLDAVDRVLCQLGLHIYMLGEPRLEPSNNRLKRAASC